METKENKTKPVIGMNTEKKFKTKDGHEVTVAHEKRMIFLYSLLQFFEFNRKINWEFVDELAQSVLKYGVLRDVVLIEIKHVLYIADGQHLFHALVRLGLPIPCIIHKCETFEQALQVVTTLNNTSKRWTMKQYVLTWCHFNPQYNELLKAQKKLGLTFTVVGALLGNTTESLAKENLKKGTFTIINDDNRMERIFQAINNFHSVTGIEKYSYTTAGFIEFVSRLGLKKYLTIEKTFVNKVKQINEIHPILPFARKKDSIQCWNDILTDKY